MARKKSRSRSRKSVKSRKSSKKGGGAGNRALFKKITARAKEIRRRDGDEWKNAMKKAWAEWRR